MGSVRSTSPPCSSLRACAHASTHCIHPPVLSFEIQPSLPPRCSPSNPSSPITTPSSTTLLPPRPRSSLRRLPPPLYHLPSFFLPPPSKSPVQESTDHPLHPPGLSQPSPSTSQPLLSLPLHLLRQPFTTSSLSPTSGLSTILRRSRIYMGIWRI